MATSHSARTGSLPPERPMGTGILRESSILLGNMSSNPDVATLIQACLGRLESSLHNLAALTPSPDNETLVRHALGDLEEGVIRKLGYEVLLQDTDPNPVFRFGTFSFVKDEQGDWIVGDYRPIHRYGFLLKGVAEEPDTGDLHGMVRIHNDRLVDMATLSRFLTLGLSELVPVPLEEAEKLSLGNRDIRPQIRKSTLEELRQYKHCGSCTPADCYCASQTPTITCKP